jgi:putative MFS transporter
MTSTEQNQLRYNRFPHPVVFWLGVAACVTGVSLHLPMYFGAKDMGYHLAGMQPDLPMTIGMVLIFAGLAASLYGLLPPRSNGIRRTTRRSGGRMSRCWW